MSELLENEEIKDMELPKDGDITERDIFIACCGEDEDNNPRSIVAVRMSKYDAATGEEIELADEVILDEPVVNIFRSPRFTMVDLTFIPNSFSFVNLTARMQDFIKAENMAGESDNIIPSIALTLNPKDHLGVFYCTGLHGAWSLMPSKVGYKIDTMRFTFDNTMFGSFVLGEQDE